MTRQRLILLILVLTLFGTTGYNKSNQDKNSKAFVLCYHSFEGNNKYLTDFSEEDLKSQIDFLQKRKFNFVTFSDIIDNKVSGNKNILITIDDGNTSVYRIYKEVFKPLNIKPIFSIYPAIIGRKKYALNWEQLRGLASDGCEIAAHGYYHLYVDKKLYEENKRKFLNEIYKSKKILEKKLNKQITIFVYPFGKRSEITIETLKTAGYKYAFTIDGRVLLLPLNKNGNLYEIPRYMLTNKNWKGVFYTIVKISASKP